MNPMPEVDPSDPKLEPVKIHPQLYKKIVSATIATYAALLALAVLTWNVMILPFLNVGFGFVVIVLCHFMFSWIVAKTDEWVALYFYERAIKVIDPGPYFVPAGLMQPKRVPRGLKQFQAPGEPEQIFHGDDKAALPAGMVRPIRITTRAPKENEKGHLDVQMTIEWSFYVQYQIFDFFQFISRVGSFEHAARLIRDTGEAVLNEFASEMTVNGMIENLKEINEEIDNRIRELVNTWGMEIYEAKALAPNLSHTLATELRNLPAERLRAEQARTKASANRFRLEEEGEGAASAEAAMLVAKAEGREAFLTAEANGLKAKKDALNIDGETVIVAEVASDAFKNADSVIVGAGDGVRDLMGMLKGGKSVLNSGGDKHGNA